MHTDTHTCKGREGETKCLLRGHKHVYSVEINNVVNMQQTKWVYSTRPHNVHAEVVHFTFHPNSKAARLMR